MRDKNLNGFVTTWVIALCFALSTQTVFAGSTIMLPDPTGTTFQGERANDYSGETTIPIGNFTGDIFPEVMVTVRNYVPNVHQGRLYIRTGTINGLPSTVNLATQSSITIEGENYAWTGSMVRVVPDLNGDRYNEILATSGVNFYIINGALSLPSKFKITDVGTTIAGRKFIATDALKDAEFGDFDKDGQVDMMFTGAGLLAGEVGLIYLSKLPAGNVTINASLFDNVKAKKFTGAVGTIGRHSITALNLDSDAQTDYIFVANGTVKIYINGDLKSTINTLGVVNAAMVFDAGDMNNDGLNDFILTGDVFPSGWTMALVFGKATWPATMNLALDGVNASNIKGISAISPELSYPIASCNVGLVVGDSTLSRVVILDKKSTWPAIYTITTAEQSDNTKIVGGVRIGTSVGCSDNLYGGIGCSADTAITVGANALNQIGNSYTVRIKK